MIKILFIHQSAEMYGSDKTLLELLQNIDRTRFLPVVVLPGSGPLKQALEGLSVEVYVAPVLKLYRKMIAPKNLMRFAGDDGRSNRILSELHQKHRFDMVYSNTLAVLSGFRFARSNRLPHVWHVHEIIESPRIFTKLFRRMLQSPRNTLTVYNSSATATFWEKNAGRDNAVTVLNGIAHDATVPINIDEIRRSFSWDEDAIVIALVGRISRWKGQKLLAEAFASLAKKHRHIRLAFIGSAPPGQEHFEQELSKFVQTLGIADKVSMIPFRNDMDTLWHALDIAVVPSTEPEPFGLVAIEAMRAGKPVIGAAHGGLLEIITPETGILFDPGNSKALESALESLIGNPGKRQQMGVNGRKRMETHFSTKRYVSELENLFEGLNKTRNSS